MGLSTYARNGIVDGLQRNTPFVVPVWCGSIHDLDPGIEGASATETLIATETDRSQITMAACVDGESTATGDPSYWIIGAVDGLVTIGYVGLHDQFAAGHWMGREPITQPVQVAEGDKVSLTSFTTRSL